STLLLDPPWSPTILSLARSPLAVITRPRAASAYLRPRPPGMRAARRPAASRPAAPAPHPQPPPHPRPAVIAQRPAAPPPASRALAVSISCASMLPARKLAHSRRQSVQAPSISPL